MSETRMLTAGGLVLGALAVLASLSPEMDRAITRLVLALLVAGTVAGLIAYRLHVLRIRREIEERGGTVLRRVDPPVRSRGRGRCRSEPRAARRWRRSGRPGSDRRRRRHRRRPSSPG